MAEAGSAMIMAEESDSSAASGGAVAPLAAAAAEQSDSSWTEVGAVAPAAVEVPDTQARHGCSVQLDGGALGLRTLRLSVARCRVAEASWGSEAHPMVCAEVAGAGVEAHDRRDPVDVVLVIDVSISMTYVIGQVRQTVAQVFEELRGEDRIGLVTFGSTARVLLPLSRKSAVPDFMGICSQIEVNGRTYMESGLREGFALLRERSEDAAGAARSVMLLLSDGMPNMGIWSVAGLQDLVRELAGGCRGSLTLHALGFTADHCISLMSALPRESRGDAGNYYYLGSAEDIQASVGDCLGSLMPAVCDDLELMVQPVAKDDSSQEEQRCWYYGPSAAEAADEAPVLGLQPAQHVQHPSMRAGERQAFLFALTPGVTRASMRATWRSTAGPQEVHLQLDWGDGSVQPELIDLKGGPKRHLSSLRVAAHTLRLNVGVALAALAVGDVAVGRYEGLHSSLLACLEDLHHVPVAAGEGPDVIFLEGMLQTLERDLGEALAQTRASQERTGLLLSFAQEHFAMRSASSLTRCRTTYSSHAQVSSRLRFLQSSGGSGGERAKLQCALVEPGLTEEELEGRRLLEDGATALEEDGFVVPGGWREGVLGLGLFVHPRTLADRRKGLPPQIDLVAEYVSAEAYNLGVRAAVQHVAVESAGADLDEEAEDVEGQPCPPGTPPAAAPPSTSRQRINGWLPVYLNKENWDVARTFAPSAFSLLATQLNAAFRPSDALQVCARLMCCAVVGFVHPTKDTGVPSHKRAPASERAIQMYCDVHRLFHEMARMYPEIKNVALAHVKGFLHSPEQRTRRATPALGDLIAYLTILDEVNWSDLAAVFVPELLRRAFARFPEPFCPESCLSVEDLIGRFDALEPEHGHVILFNVVFNRLVARPSEPWSVARSASAASRDTEGASMSGKEVCEMYDRRWGQLPPARRSEVASEIRRIGCLGSVSMVLRELLPFSLSDADIGELLLWGAKHAYNNKAIQDVPDLRKMPRALTEVWALRAKLRKALLTGLERNLARGVPSRECLQKLLYACEKSEEDYAAASRSSSARTASDPSTAKGESEWTERLSAELSYTPGEAEMSREEAEAVRGLVNRRRYMEPFDLQVVVCPDDGRKSRFVLTGVSYGSAKTVSTGWDLRVAIAAQTKTDPRKMRLLVYGATRLSAWPSSPCSCGTLAWADVADDPADGAADGAAAVALSNSAPLALWQLGESLGNVVVEVHPKHRGGRKLGRPGNGWHKERKRGSTYAMGIAGAIVRETAFSNVKQYCTIVSDGCCVSTLLGLPRMFDGPIVVLCSAGTAAPLRHELRSASAGQQHLVIAEEVEAPGEAPSADPPAECEVEVPPEAEGARLVVTYGSPLRETASLAKVVRCARGRRDAEVVVFHLITDRRPLLLEGPADVEALDGALGEDRYHLQAELQVPGAQHMPAGAALVGAEGKEDPIPALSATLPHVVQFRLRSFGLGFVVRLRQRFQIKVTDVMYEALQKLMSSRPVEGEEEPEQDDDWVTL